MGAHGVHIGVDEAKEVGVEAGEGFGANERASEPMDSGEARVETQLGLEQMRELVKRERR